MSKANPNAMVVSKIINAKSCLLNLMLSVIILQIIFRK